MSTAKFCIRHKVSTLLAVIMIIVFGAVFTTRLQMALLPDMARQDFTDTSFYDYLARCGLKVCHASRTLEVIVPPPEIAAALELSPFAPAVYVESVGFDARGRRVEYAQSYYPAGSSKFLIEIDQ